LTQSETDSLDLVHATVERVLEHDPGDQLGAGLEFWMMRVMKNLWIDQMRSRSRWGRLVSAMPETLDPSDDGDDARATEQRIELAQVRLAVDELPEEQALPIKLVLLGEMSYADAAVFLDVPIGTLTSRLSRGRTALLRRFQAHEA
jgi:RNA polymerase sigma-70 factor (ECF subfamily)